MFLFLTLLLYPLGYLLAFALPRKLQTLSCFGLSAVFFVVLVLLWRYFGFSTSELLIPLYLISLLAIWATAKRGGFSELCSLDSLPGYLFMFAYYLLVLALSAYPDGELTSISGEGVRQITGLPIDNIIPFNFSRYLVEDISFEAMEVVPTWPASSRGPLAGVLVAVVFVMLSVSENLAWLGTSPGVYFVFQSTLVFLNSLVLYAVWRLSRYFFSSRVAGWSALAIATSSFVLTNILFTWPKFLMTYFVLSALMLLYQQSAKRPLFAYLGVLFAGAYLSHQMALFYLLPLALYLFLRSIRSLQESLRAAMSHSIVRQWYIREKLLDLVYFISTLSLSLLPWFLLKAGLPQAGKRMQYLHLFCISDQEVSALSLADAASRYIEENSFFEILSARVQNLWFPFDVFQLGISLGEIFSSPYRLFSSMALASFFQLLFAVGPIAFFLAVFSLRVAPRAREKRVILQLLSLPFAALVVASVVFACPASTLNHVWAYPAIVILFMAAAYCTRAESIVPSILFVFACGSNTLLTLLNLFYPSDGVLWLHASSQYYLAPSIALVLCALSFLFMMSIPGETYESHSS